MPPRRKAAQQAEAATKKIVSSEAAAKAEAAAAKAHRVAAASSASGANPTTPKGPLTPPFKIIATYSKPNLVVRLPEKNRSVLSVAQYVNKTSSLKQTNGQSSPRSIDSPLSIQNDQIRSFGNLCRGEQQSGGRSSFSAQGAQKPFDQYSSPAAPPSTPSRILPPRIDQRRPSAIGQNMITSFEPQQLESGLSNLPSPSPFALQNPYPSVGFGQGSMGFPTARRSGIFADQLQNGGLSRLMINSDNEQTNRQGGWDNDSATTYACPEQFVSPTNFSQTGSSIAWSALDRFPISPLAYKGWTFEAAPGTPTKFDLTWNTGPPGNQQADHQEYNSMHTEVDNKGLGLRMQENTSMSLPLLNFYGSSLEVDSIMSDPPLVLQVSRESESETQGSAVANNSIGFVNEREESAAQVNSSTPVDQGLCESTTTIQPELKDQSKKNLEPSSATEKIQTERLPEEMSGNNVPQHALFNTDSTGSLIEKSAPGITQQGSPSFPPSDPEMNKIQVNDPASSFTTSITNQIDFSRGLPLIPGFSQTVLQQRHLDGFGEDPEAIRLAGVAAKILDRLSKSIKNTQQSGASTPRFAGHPDFKYLALSHIKRVDGQDCSFCTYEADFGISKDDVLLPQEALGSTCLSCREVNGAFDAMMRGERSFRHLTRERTKEIQELEKTDAQAGEAERREAYKNSQKYWRAQTMPQNTTSAIDGQKISRFKGILTCRGSPYGQIDVGKVNICRTCLIEKINIIKHGNHPEFMPIAQEGRGCAHTRRCMICPQLGTQKCTRCPLRLCDSCCIMLKLICKGYLDNLFYATGVGHNRNDAFLLRSDGGGF